MNNLKYNLIEKCLQILNERADNTKNAMEELQQSANEYGLPKDRYDSFRAQVLRKRDLFAEQYQKSLEEIELIKKIDPEKISEKVEFGSLVITNKQNLFISISLGKMELENAQFYAISAQVPIFKAIQNKKAGDKFEFNGNKFEILELL
ncbi:MAG: hypothetical protein A2W99_02295 [Bacteroidetes bacterium GWF2_33_16]|nr:MAG: hypothetical protein A2X00_15860 [Bacteroidetes bacterium GWE2_32_14]OFY07093.1 MAG: hypothetical protein A2W99_02295 [Bacteroidetes bacterium GWF2_33_16]